MVWWMILYWPVMGGLIFIANRVATRHPANSIERHQWDLALGCAIMALPVVPLIYWFCIWVVT